MSAPRRDPAPLPPDAASRRHLRAIWTFCGLLSLCFAILGIFLPVLPTTPLIILAAFCFGKGSPRLRARLLRHPRFGPMVTDWENTGAIPRRAKQLAVSMMAATFLVCLALGLAWYVLAAQAVLMGIGAIYVLSRPDR